MRDRLPLFIPLLLLGVAVTADTSVSEDGKRVGIWCEGSAARLECPQGEVIFNVSAMYGRSSINTCNMENGDYATNCHNIHQSTSFLRERCDGKTECSLDDFSSLSPPSIHPGCKDNVITFYLETIFYCRPLGSTTTTLTPPTLNVKEVGEKDHTIDEDEKEEKLTTRTYISTHSSPCRSLVSGGLIWPTTERGQTAIVQCPSGSQGRAQWRCGSDGLWSMGGANLTGCISQNVQTNFGLIQKDIALRKSAELSEKVRILSENTRMRDLMGGDIPKVLDVAKELSQDLSWMERTHRGIARRSMIVTMENVIRSRAAWESGWKEEEKANLASNILSALEKIHVAATADIDDMNTGEVFQEKSIYATLQRVVKTDVFRTGQLILTRGNDEVLLPTESLPSTSGEFFVYFAVIDGLKDQFVQKKSLANESRIVSHIVGVTVIENGKVSPVRGLNGKKVHLSLSHSSSLDGLSNPRCVYLDSSRSTWSTRGCSLIHHNDTMTLCQCDHLTHFAVLMDVASPQLSSTHTSILTLITYIGCIVSIICLLLSLLSFCLFTRHGGDRVFIHKNLCLSLASAQLLFIAAVWSTDDLLSCRVIAASLLYLFLCSILWMLAEGVQLYLLLVEVFSTRSRKRHYALFCYVVPAIVVLTSLILDNQSFGTENHCWLSTSSWVFLCSFVVPTGVVMACNSFLLCLALCVVARHSQKGYMPCRHDNDGRKARTWLKGSFALCSLLGLSWLLGFVWLESPTASVVVAYSFTVCNCLQGLFIFLFHVVFNEKMRSDAHSWLSRHHFPCVSSSSDGSSSQRTGKAFSPTGDSTIFMEGETSDSSLLGPRALYTHPSFMAQQALLHNHGDPTYDYAHITYSDMLSVAPSSLYSSHPPLHPSYAPPPYLRQYYGGVGTNGTTTIGLYGVPPDRTRKPPPEDAPPSPPTSLPPSSRLSQQPSTRRPPSSKLSDDSAYCDSSNSSVLASEVTSTGATVLRIDLKRNPPIFCQDL